jgi:hypothetical protein
MGRSRVGILALALALLVAGCGDDASKAALARCKASTLARRTLNLQLAGLRHSWRMAPTTTAVPLSASRGCRLAGKAMARVASPELTYGGGRYTYLVEDLVYAGGEAPIAAENSAAWESCLARALSKELLHLRTARRQHAHVEALSPPKLVSTLPFTVADQVTVAYSVHQRHYHQTVVTLTTLQEQMVIVTEIRTAVPVTGYATALARALAGDARLEQSYQLRDGHNG